MLLASYRILQQKFRSKNIAPMIKQKSDAELLKNEVFRVRK